MRYCKICGETGQMHKHHVVSRKQQPALIKCELNLVGLCVGCHNAVHNKDFYNLKKLKLEKQREYFEVFNEESYTKELIKELLGINQKYVDKLLKTIPIVNGKYEKEEIIRASMGGKLLIDTLEYQR